MDPWETPPVDPRLRAIRAVASIGVVLGAVGYVAGRAVPSLTVQAVGVTLAAVSSFAAGTLNLVEPAAAYYVGAAGRGTDPPSDRRLRAVRIAGALYLAFGVALVGWIAVVVGPL